MASEIRVEVCYPGPAHTWLRALALPAGATVAQAIEASRFAQEFPDVDVWALGPAVYGRRAGRDTPLADGDRVEICRALSFDPKESRRRRVEHRRARQAAEGKERPPGLI